jgi:hypothetical protein
MINTSLAIFLLATLALTFMVPAMSGISLLQHVKAATSGQNGKGGNNFCSDPSKCHVSGGACGFGNVMNTGMSFNGNGGNGGTTHCGLSSQCIADVGNGGDNNFDNSGHSRNDW